jgi:phosphate transport system substrate-binding protein
VKVAVIEGTELSDENVRTGKYPYSRETYFYTNGAPTGEVKSFVDFVVSEEGQAIARQVGFVPVK